MIIRDLETDGYHLQNNINWGMDVSYIFSGTTLSFAFLSTLDTWTIKNSPENIYVFLAFKDKREARKAYYGIHKRQDTYDTRMGYRYKGLAFAKTNWTERISTNRYRKYEFYVIGVKIAWLKLFCPTYFQEVLKQIRKFHIPVTGTLLKGRYGIKHDIATRSNRYGLSKAAKEERKKRRNDTRNKKGT